MDRVIQVHPCRNASWPDYPTEQYSKYEIWWVFGWEYDLSTFMSRIVFGGVPQLVSASAVRSVQNPIMTKRSSWALTPRQSIDAECVRRGHTEVVAGCVRLAGGDYSDKDLLVALAGPAANRFLDGQAHDDEYWPRIWGLRGLLWAWRDDTHRDSALSVVRACLGDDSWRVREMAAKVVARHVVDDVLDDVATLRTDPVTRVRVAAERAVTALTQAHR